MISDLTPNGRRSLTVCSRILEKHGVDVLNPPDALRYRSKVQEWEGYKPQTIKNVRWALKVLVKNGLTRYEDPLVGQQRGKRGTGPRPFNDKACTSMRAHWARIYADPRLLEELKAKRKQAMLNYHRRKREAREAQAAVQA